MRRTDRLDGVSPTSASGQPELVGRGSRHSQDAGYRADAEIAAEVDISQTVPLLVDGHSFVQAAEPRARN